MAGFPLTAWALRHPWGDDIDAVLDGLRSGSPGPKEASVPRSANDLVDALLEELAARWAPARARWGASRVAVVLADPDPEDRSGAILEHVRRSTGCSGPAYGVRASGTRAVASAGRLLQGSLADAVLVGAVGETCGALLVLERHGDAFVELRGSAEATGAAAPAALDPAAIRRVVASAWSAADRPALGYVQGHARAEGPHAPTERHALQAELGPVPCWSPPGTTPGTGGVVDVLLAIASLRRGFTPPPSPQELEHDRVLVHAADEGGHHIALLLEARP